jgi:predicted phage-related endonuclease
MKPLFARDQLLADLETGIGASECHHLFDLEPYGCRRHLWYTKTRATPDFIFHGNTDTKRGTFLEPHVAELYKQATGRGLRQTRCWRHKRMPSWICHPDRIINRPKDNHTKGPGILEIKCPSVRSFVKIRREGLPANWILQLQHSLGVSGLKWGAYAVFSAELWELIQFDAERDNELIATIERRVDDFDRIVQHGPAPERLPASDKRCRSCPFRTQCQGDALLDALAKDDGRFEPGDLPRDYALEQATRDVIEAKRLKQDAEEVEEAAKAILAEKMGDRVALETAPGVKVYYRPHEMSKLDAVALRKDHPEVAEKYERRSVVRSLRVYGT